jgi:hypothetical protein
MSNTRIARVHVLKWTPQETIEEINSPKEWPIKFPRPKNLNKDVIVSDKIMFHPQDVVRTIVAITDNTLFLK